MPNQIRALIVEDNPADAYLEKRALRNILPVEFDVYCADRLEDALKLLGDVQFDVILLDLGLPESGGLDTLERVRSAEESVAIVVMTGSAEEATSLQALDRGAQDFLLKSEITPDTLHRTIRFAIHRKQAECLSTQRGGNRESRLRAVLEAASDAIITVDADGNIHDWNHEAEELFGWRASEVAGRPLVVFLALGPGDFGCEGAPVFVTIFDRSRQPLSLEARSSVVRSGRQQIRAISLRLAGSSPTSNNRKGAATVSK